LAVRYLNAATAAAAGHDDDDSCEGVTHKHISSLAVRLSVCLSRARDGFLEHELTNHSERAMQGL